MNTTSHDPEKQKRAPRRPWGCMRFLWIPLLIAVVCYGAMWVFARVGGEWALSDPFTVPPGSEPININLTNRAYGTDTLTYYLYVHDWTPDELRDWFEQEGFSFDVKCYDPQPVTGVVACYDDRSERYADKYVTSTRQRLYELSAFYTVIIPRVDTTNWTTIPVTRLMLNIYEDQDEFDNVRFFYPPNTTEPNPHIEVPQGKTLFCITTLSPQKFKWWFVPSPRVVEDDM